MSVDRLVEQKRELNSGLLIGCKKDLEIMRHFKVSLCSKEGLFQFFLDCCSILYLFCSEGKMIVESNSWRTF